MMVHPCSTSRLIPAYSSVYENSSGLATGLFLFVQEMEHTPYNANIRPARGT